MRKLASGKYQLRYYDSEGKRQTGGSFPTRSAAFKHYRDLIEPRLNGQPVTPEFTFAELVGVYLERHGQLRSPSTIRILRHRLARPLDAYGEIPLRELEGMAGDLADFRATLPPRFAHDVMRALRQTFAAGVRYGYMRSNPALAAGDNPAPKPRAVRAYTLAELDALEAELGPEYAPFVPLVAATGLRPLEAARLERRDVDRNARLLAVRGTKTHGSHRQVPLSGRALDALERLPPDSAGCCSRRPRAARSTSTTSAGANGHRPSKRQGSQRRPASITCARPSPPTRSRPGSPSSSWRRSWARASR